MLITDLVTSSILGLLEHVDGLERARSRYVNANEILTLGEG
jgi:hypothetical protein